MCSLLYINVVSVLDSEISNVHQRVEELFRVLVIERDDGEVMSIASIVLTDDVEPGKVVLILIVTFFFNDRAVPSAELRVFVLFLDQRLEKIVEEFEEALLC